MESSKIDSESKCTEDVEMVDIQQHKEQSSAELQQSFQVSADEDSTFETESIPSKNESVITGDGTRTSKVKVKAVNGGASSSKKVKLSNVGAETFKVVPEDTYPLYFKSACKIDPKSLIGTGSLSKSSDEANPPKSEENVDKFSEISNVSKVSTIKDEFSSLKTFQNDQINKDIIFRALGLPKVNEVYNVGEVNFDVPKNSNELFFKPASMIEQKNVIATGPNTLAKSSDEDRYPKSEDKVDKLSQVSKILDKVATVTEFLKGEMEQTACKMYDRLQIIDREKREFKKIQNAIKELQLEPQSTCEASEPDAEAILRQVKRKEDALMRFLEKKYEQEEEMRKLEELQRKTEREDQYMR